MRAVIQSFLQMLKLIRRDGMLLAAGTAPPLAGAAIRYGIPFGEEILVRCTGRAAVLGPYYGLFDAFFACLTPVMLCFISAMVMLEEHDEGIDRALFVTGLGREGYFVSRTLLPALVAFGVTLVLLPVFHLTALSFGMIALLSLAGALQGILIALLIVTTAANKLEGMAVAKLSSVIILGAAIAYVVPAPHRTGFAWLPSFWVGMGVAKDSPGALLLSALLSWLWIRVLQRLYAKKIL